jgi:hypothetical protein
MQLVHIIWCACLNCLTPSLFSSARLAGFRQVVAQRCKPLPLSTVFNLGTMLILSRHYATTSPSSPWNSLPPHRLLSSTTRTVPHHSPVFPFGSLKWPKQRRNDRRRIFSRTDCLPSSTLHLPLLQPYKSYQINGTSPPRSEPPLRPLLTVWKFAPAVSLMNTSSSPPSI